MFIDTLLCKAINNQLLQLTPSPQCRLPIPFIAGKLLDHLILCKWFLPKSLGPISLFDKIAIQAAKSRMYINNRIDELKPDNPKNNSLRYFRLFQLKNIKTIMNNV